MLGATFRRNGAGAPLRCDCVGKVRADEAGTAGDDVAHEEIWARGCLGVSEWNLEEWCESLKLLYKSLHRDLDCFFRIAYHQRFPKHDTICGY